MIHRGLRGKWVWFLKTKCPIRSFLSGFLVSGFHRSGFRCQPQKPLKPSSKEHLQLFGAGCPKGPFWHDQGRHHPSWLCPMIWFNRSIAVRTIESFLDPYPGDLQPAFLGGEPLILVGSSSWGVARVWGWDLPYQMKEYIFSWKMSRATGVRPRFEKRLLVGVLCASLWRPGWSLFDSRRMMGRKSSSTKIPLFLSLDFPVLRPWFP